MPEDEVDALRMMRRRKSSQKVATRAAILDFGVFESIARFLRFSLHSVLPDKRDCPTLAGCSGAETLVLSHQTQEDCINSSAPSAIPHSPGLLGLIPCLHFSDTVFLSHHPLPVLRAHLLLLLSPAHIVLVYPAYYIVQESEPCLRLLLVRILFGLRRELLVKGRMSGKLPSARKCCWYNC